MPQSEKEEQMDKDMEEIIKRERLIGQHLLLVRMYHVENERGFSLIKIDQVAEWMNMSEDEIKQYIWACNELNYSQICYSATLKFCKENPYSAYTVRFFYEIFGENYLKVVIYKAKSELGTWIERIEKRYQEKYQGKYGEAKFSDEELGDAFEFFGKYFLKTIENVRKCGFEWDIIVEMLENKFSKEEILALNLLINNR